MDRAGMGGKYGITGLYDKRGWFYFQPPTPHKGAGQPNAIALKTKDLVTAINLTQDKSVELTVWQEARRRTLEEMLPLYFAAKKDDALSSRRQREDVLNGFKTITGNPKIDAINQEMIRTWLEHVKTAGGHGGHTQDKRGRKMRTLPKVRSAATLKTYLVVVKAFLNWLVAEEYLRESPAAGMRRALMRVTPTKRHEFLTEAQREKVLALEMPPYLRFILIFGFFCGLRDGELLAMTPSWIWVSPDGTRGTLTVQSEVVTYADGSAGLWQPKVRHKRTIPLHPRVLEFLKEYGRPSPWMLRPDKASWPGENLKSKRFDASRAMATLAKLAGLKKLNYHLMRHTFATLLAMKGVTMAEIAGLLGDTITVTEDHYAGYSPNAKQSVNLL